MIANRAGSQPPACPACCSTDSRWRFEKKGRQFWRCQACGLIRQSPLPTLEELTAYYNQSYENGLYRDFVEAEPMKRLTAQARLKQVQPHSATGRWLDIGCSDGVFLQELTSTGAEAEGVELSEVAAARAQARGMQVFTGAIDAYSPTNRFANLTAFDVLEHVVDPTDFIRQAHRLLDPGGMLAIAVPHVGSLSCRLMGSRWYFYIPEEHLHVFSRVAMQQLLKRCGFESIKSWPTYKPLTFEYSMVQFREYNPLIYRMLKPLAWLTPRRLQRVTAPLYIGELMVVAKRGGG